jgi:DNA-binding Lrp family transcriptional regulator
VSQQSIDLSAIERSLLDAYQRGLPLEPRPFSRIAEVLGLSEQQVLDGLGRLQRAGVVSRVGPVFRPNRVGVSTLAALSVPPESLEVVAAIVSAFPEVNHNYEREHDYNLWFVVTAADTECLHQVLQTIAERTGLEPLDLPMLEDYFIDLGFPLQWT